jgi:glucokinase
VQGEQSVFGKNEYVLALDIGGTFIKSGLIQASGEAMEIPPVAVDSNASAENIIASFSDAIQSGIDQAEKLSGQSVGGIGIAIPGPFDYSNGVSLMEHKFASIYRINLPAELAKKLPAVAGVPIRFCHDANAFVTGEMWRGAGCGFTRVIGVTLGTGLGVAASVDDKVLVDSLGSPADEVSLWDKPYKGGISEDAVSTRAIFKKYLQTKPNYDTSAGVKGIAEAALRGEADAKAVFDQFGDDLGQVLMPLVKRLNAQMIIFGGQIAKSFSLIEPSLQTSLGKLPSPPQVGVGKLGPMAQLYGAVSCWRTK